ncbi:MAG TPA: hypothetical protein VM940_00215 [Chthoniobacterales bacterium]|jgi:hypothetical protein|nr:hypothetical protein [Chthoniobacterales bacterium]
MKNKNTREDAKAGNDEVVIYLGFDAEYREVDGKNIVLSQQFYGIAGEATWEDIYYIDETADAQ